MSRNYRIICQDQKVKKKFKGLAPERIYGLSEVYYDEDNQPNGWTEPDVWCESVKEVVDDLKMKLKDAEKSRRKVLYVDHDKLIPLKNAKK